MGEELRIVAEKLVDIKDKEWEALRIMLKPKTLKKNEYYLRQGEVCRQMGFIVQGYVRLFFLSGDAEITKDFSFENSFCGSYASFISGAPSRFNVKAMEDVTLYLLTRENLEVLTDIYPCWQKFVRISVENLFVRKELREASFLLDSIEEKYSNLLKEHKEIVQRVPLKYIASYLGTSAETISRIRAKIK
jgi:CRP-like cAMP-binding protein